MQIRNPLKIQGGGGTKQNKAARVPAPTVLKVAGNSISELMFYQDLNIILVLLRAFSMFSEQKAA